jgi:hypothetical protein
LQKNHVIVDFSEKCLWKVDKEGRMRYKFSSTTGDIEEKDREIETNGDHTDHSTDASLPRIPPCTNYPGSPPAEPDQRSALSDLHTHLDIKPLKEIEFGETRVLARIDTGAEGSLISETAYQSITATGYATLQLPAQTTKPRFSCGCCRLNINTISLLKFQINGKYFEDYFIVEPYLSDPVLLGRGFLQKNHVIIDFFEKCLWKVEKEGRRRYKFSSTTEDIETNVGHTDHWTDASLPSLPQCPSYPASPPAEPDQRGTLADLLKLLDIEPSNKLNLGKLVYWHVLTQELKGH